MKIEEHINEAERVLRLALLRDADGDALERVQSLVALGNLHATIAIAKCAARSTPGVRSRSDAIFGSDDSR